METDILSRNAEEYNYNYEFLNSERARKFFADTDFALRSGRHIQNFGNDFRLFDFLNDFYEKGLSRYYQELLGMILKKEYNDREVTKVNLGMIEPML
jgi:hypothetical protein